MNIYRVIYMHGREEAEMLSEQSVLIAAPNYAGVEEVVKPYGYLKNIVSIRKVGSLFNPGALK